jgi:hypothetical protein
MLILVPTAFLGQLETTHDTQHLFLILFRVDLAKVYLKVILVLIFYCN